MQHHHGFPWPLNPAWIRAWFKSFFYIIFLSTVFETVVLAAVYAENALLLGRSRQFEKGSVLQCCVISVYACMICMVFLSCLLCLYPKLLRTPLSSPAMCYWEPVFSSGPGAVIKDMEIMLDHCVFTLRGPEGRLQLQTFLFKAPDDVTIHHVSKC